MLDRYERRRRRLYKLLRPPLPLVYNNSEQFLPHCEGKKLFIGGAGGRIPAGFLNLDISEAPGVDIVSDVQDLHIPDSSIAAIECDAVLEHVQSPEKAISEMHRVLKSGGYLHVVVPFCHPFHEYPSDFHRWSIEGLRHLLREFDILHVGTRTGPTATLLAFILEYLKLFTPAPMKKMVYGVAGWLVWPMRYIDLWLNKKPDSHTLANHMTALARKH